MPDTDPGSLDRLHDIVVPPPVPWWPPAPTWYAVFAILLALTAVLVWQLVAWRLRNRYRRAALAELEQINPGSLSALATVAELVKRVALAAFPREKVAALTGAEWLRFLDTTGATTNFTRGAGRVLGDLEYTAGPHLATPDLIAVVRHWISHHRSDLPC